jgi:hypothetical protein
MKKRERNPPVSTKAAQRRAADSAAVIEALCSKLQGIFDRRESGLFSESFAYPAASGGECARFYGSTPAQGAFEGLLAGTRWAVRNAANCS